MCSDEFPSSSPLKDVHQCLDAGGNLPNGFAESLNGPVRGMACSDTADRHAIEQPAGE